MKGQLPAFSFPLIYAETVVICEVVMQDNGYEILFDGRWMASISHTKEWTWIHSSGVILPERVVSDIGSRIESEYK